MKWFRVVNSVKLIVPLLSLSCNLFAVCKLQLLLRSSHNHVISTVCIDFFRQQMYNNM